MKTKLESVSSIWNFKTPLKTFLYTGLILLLLYTNIATYFNLNDVQDVVIQLDKRIIECEVIEKKHTKALSDINLWRIKSDSLSSLNKSLQSKNESLESKLANNKSNELNLHPRIISLLKNQDILHMYKGYPIINLDNYKGCRFQVNGRRYKKLKINYLDIDLFQ